MSALRLLSSTMSKVEASAKANSVQMSPCTKPTATHIMAIRVAVTGNEKRLTAILF